MKTKKALTDAQLSAIQMLLHEDIPIKEIASRLDVHSSTIYSWLNYNERFIREYKRTKRTIEAAKNAQLLKKASIILSALARKLDKYNCESLEVAELIIDIAKQANIEVEDE